MQFVHGLGDDDVGQEAGHGLLGASPRIAGEVVKRIEDGAGNAGRDGDGEAARGGIGAGRITVAPTALAGAGEYHARACGALLYAEGQYRQRDFERVTLFVGESLRREHGLAGSVSFDSPFGEALAFGGDADLLLLAVQD